MSDNVYEYLKGKNAKATALMERNTTLASFVAAICYNFDTYCRAHNINPYTAEITNAIITREGKIVADIKGRS